MHSGLSRLVEQAASICVLTGAGISTESGIPDFRSPGGVWSKYRIIEYPEFMASESARLEDWRRRFDMEDALGVVKPNAGHRWIAGLVSSGKCAAVVTQNIDGLHQEAGIGDDKVVEIHGNARHAVCTACGLRHEIGECRTMLERTGRTPICKDCGGIVKSAVVMFGETMPEEAFARAVDLARSCDLFLAVGTSLVVHPAAMLPVHAVRNRARLAILNRDPTELDGFADLVIHAGIGATLA